MGYAGYFSTTARLKEKPTEYEAALAAVPELASLEILEKLHYNVAVAPKEAKYRRIKLSNPKIKANIGDVPEARAVLSLLGWEEIQDGEELFLTLPEDKSITMAQVRTIITAQQELKKMSRSTSAASLRAAEQNRQQTAV